MFAEEQNHGDDHAHDGRHQQDQDAGSFQAGGDHAIDENLSDDAGGHDKKSGDRSNMQYAREGAIVFEGIDFFIVWLFLMMGRLDWLANRYVNLDGKKRSQDAIIAIFPPKCCS